MQMLTINRTNLEDFLPKIKVYLFNVDEKVLPDTVLLSLLRDTLQDFCKRTHAIKRTYNLQAQEGVMEYLLPADECETPFFGVSLRNYRSIEIPSYARGYSSFGGGLNQASISFYPYYDRKAWILRDGAVSFPRYQKYDGDYECVVAVMPSHTACEVDSQILEEWQDAITDGVLSRVMRIPSMPSTSMQAADYYEKRFFEKSGRISMNLLAGSVAGGVKLSKNWMF
jgi:hypothetical protein